MTIDSFPYLRAQQGEARRLLVGLLRHACRDRGGRLLVVAACAAARDLAALERHLDVFDATVEAGSPTGSPGGSVH